MIEMPIPVRAIDGDAHGQARPGLSEAALIVLAQEVIARLARWTTEATRQAALEQPRVVPDVDMLVDALIGLDPRAAKTMVLDAHRRGATHEELCLHHLGPAARRLGDRWEADELLLHHVALAAGRILHLLRDLRDLAPPVVPRGGRSALFASVPGDQHTIGITAAADMFRDFGWDVDLRLGQSEEQLCTLVRDGGYPIVGLSAASVDRVRALARVIVSLRVIAPKILIFVSGYIAKVEPDIAVRVGADGAAWDMQTCKSEMERLHRMLPQLMMAGH